LPWHPLSQIPSRPVSQQPPSADYSYPGTTLQSVGPRSEPRRERTQEYKVTPTCAVLGSDLCFSSMVAARIQSAVLLKVQPHWPRPERLAPWTPSRENTPG
jgi:hypothetical protein